MVTGRLRTTEGPSSWLLQMVVQEAKGRSQGPCFDIGTIMQKDWFMGNVKQTPKENREQSQFTPH